MSHSSRYGRRAPPVARGGLLRARFAFGVGGFGVSLVYTSMGVLLLYFYTHVYGLTPAQAGTTIFVAALCDAVLDPIVGWIVSRTDTRFGRYRPFLIFGSIPMSLAFVAIFMVPPSEPEWRMVLAVCSLATFRGLFQFIYMPYSAMIVRLSRDSDERAYIEGWRAWFTSAGSLLISFGGLSLALYFGDGDARKGFILLSILIGVLAAVAFMTCGCLSREIDQGHAQPDVSSPIEVVRLLRQNKPFLVVVSASFAAQVAYAMLLHASVLYFGKSEGQPEYARWTLASMTAAGLVASFAWPRVSARYGKRFAWMTGSSLAATALGAMYLLRLDSIVAYASLFFLVGVGFQAGFIMMFAAAADAIDHGERQTGRRAEAMSFALLTFVIKASLAIGGGAVGWLFSAAGLGNPDTDHAEVVQGMRRVFFVLPAVLFLLSAAIARSFKISEAEQPPTAGEKDTLASQTALEVRSSLP